ncbi:DUF547 domain-containing protein [Vibrio tapetis]|uniref:DUF547 domain-containing protein n=1 Tax=Vibrio tapetis subsp. tapetis TaxID=1671868 RepID=A0A2N8Z879_9VIBR|nr:DUF547 domain-containing protein [Vibrio tapetis]SON48117.1 conserved exported protein of unknown function [Vibrio tapetis subsp. tapetis]
MKQTLTLLFVLFISLLSPVSSAAPKSELWAYWNVSNESNQQSISHQDWQQFLDDYLVLEGQHHLVTYANVSNPDKKQLQNYIDQLALVDPRQYSKKEQYAYWVNLYNALTIDLILDNYPIESITKLGGFFSFGPWGDELVTVAGKSLTLNDIEHRILRPIWQDPRTHYAVNCASLGCPNLQQTAFTAQNTNVLLEQAAHEFINSDKGVKLSASSTQLSSIYDWFKTDFGADEAALLKHIQQYRPDIKELVGKVRYDYDWNLNQP